MHKATREVSARTEGNGGQESLGSPFAQVHGENDTVPVVAGQNHHLFAARMPAEDRTHFLSEEDRTAPPVGDGHGCKGGVQIADAAFERAETVRGLAIADIIAVQTMRAAFARTRADISGDESGAKDDAVRIEQASPQIGKVDGVKRAARRDFFFYDPPPTERCSLSLHYALPDG